MSSFPLFSVPESKTLQKLGNNFDDGKTTQDESQRRDVMVILSWQQKQRPSSKQDKDEGIVITQWTSLVQERKQREEDF
jgi:hypothetical protein